VAVLSVALAGGVVWMWVRSYWVHGRVGFSTKEARYTLHSERGRLRLMGPPGKGEAYDEYVARTVAGDLKNAYVGWVFYNEGRGSSVYPKGLENYPWVLKHDATRLPRAALLALDDPERFVAAHVELTWSANNFVMISPVERREDGACVTTWNGLRVELMRQGWNDGISVMSLRGYLAPGSWRVDPAGRIAIRDMWHDRLDVKVGSMPYWPLVVTALVPLWWCRLRWREERRGRKGLCVACGYDLRATRERCPECGSVARSG
jgi:hypothetical protein